MNRKTSILTHVPSRFQLQTPLLIPSFSSRGFRGSGKTSEVRKLLLDAGQFATEAYLISAFDIAKGHIPPPTELQTKPEWIVLDSGGYEVSGIVDSASLSPAEADAVWTPDDLQSVLDAWPDEQAAIFVSYDHPCKFQSLEKQISEARKLKTKFGKHLHCFLIKPESAEERSLKSVLGNVIVKASQLHGFDVIGITDKGLGSSPIDRMMQIAKLRRALDEANCHAPLHVFGSLDPLSICLYYLAGAEIFDGLTWLRFSFTMEGCIYPSGYEPRMRGLHVKDVASEGQRLASNYQAILKLQEDLRFFSRTDNFGLLPYSEFLQSANADLISRFSK